MINLRKKREKTIKYYSVPGPIIFIKIDFFPMHRRFGLKFLSLSRQCNGHQRGLVKKVEKRKK